MPVDLGEQLELSLCVLDDLPIVGADEERVVDLDGALEWGVDFEDLLGVAEREHCL